MDKANIFLSQIFVVNFHKSFSLFMEKILVEKFTFEKNPDLTSAFWIVVKN